MLPFKSSRNIYFSKRGVTTRNQGMFPSINRQYQQTLDVILTEVTQFTTPIQQHQLLELRSAKNNNASRSVRGARFIDSPSTSLYQMKGEGK